MTRAGLVTTLMRKSMSTGNPFRRAPSQSSRLPDEHTSTDSRSARQGAVSEPVSVPKPKVRKKVVIQTPPHSPEDSRAVDRGIPRPDLDTSPTRELQYGGGLEQQAGGVLGSSLPQEVVVSPAITLGAQAGATRGIGSAPYNPFARTLATSERSLASGSSTLAEEVTINGTTQQQRHRLDVDAFKNMLLTGSAPPAAPHPQTQDLGQRLQDSSSSSIDTASNSRSSTFDAMQEAHPESPRTSLDDLPSDSSSDERDDEQSSLMGPIGLRPLEEGPKAPPKHVKLPQTVSFADFDESIPAAGMFTAHPRLPSLSTTHLTGILRPPPMPRSPSDLNKPLPLPPTPIEAPVKEDIPQMESPAQPEELTPVQAPAKRVLPPPPPAARRVGPSTAVTGRGRSTSDISQRSEISQTASIPSISTGGNTAKAAPPPPPSRRTLQQPQQPTLPLPDLPHPFPPPLPAGSETTASSASIPPPPPRRTYGSSAIRASSTASHASVPCSDSASSVPTSAAPPAPPPRRGAAKRSSIDSSSTAAGRRRVSEQSVGSLEEAPVSPSGGVLDEMEAFQREVDAMRARGGG